jgi:hypothetical protein
MANHGKQKFNMKISWYFMDGDNSTLAESVETLAKMQFTSLDIAGIATKDIQAGEELFLNYGEHWEEEFKLYSADTEAWEQENDFDISLQYSLDFLLQKPQFRYPIDAPKAFCPEKWKYVDKQYLQYYYSDEDIGAEKYEDTSSRILQKMNSEARRENNEL